MARDKRTKTKIKRRSPGLVITPPVPRPVASDHPARLLFKDAIESAKASPETDLTENQPVPLIEVEQGTRLSEEVSAPVSALKTASDREADRAAPLQIFQELKSKPEALLKADTALPIATAPAPKTELEGRREHSDAFEGIFGQWRPFLSEAQMYILEALYNMTHKVGTDRCLTSMPKLATAAGVSERQTYNVVKELEKHGFIERPETFNTPTKKGTIFRLNLTRQVSPSGINRRYHYGD
jgi:hypothetical protein